MSDSDRAALNNAIGLVADLRLDCTLNTRGEVLVPIADGSQTIIISPMLLAGDEWLSLQVVIRLNIPNDPASQEQLAAFSRETSLYYGAKCLPLTYSVRLMSDLPAEGLVATTLLRAMRRLAWILTDCESEIVKLPGSPPDGVFAQRLGVKRSIVAEPEGISEIHVDSSEP